MLQPGRIAESMRELVELTRLRNRGADTLRRLSGVVLSSLDLLSAERERLTATKNCRAKVSVSVSGEPMLYANKGSG